jgi:hypothetical protein
MSAALVIGLAIWLAPLAVAVLVAPWLLAARLRRAVRS